MSSARRPKRGRPSIQQPEMVWGRVGTEVREQIDELAESLDIPKARVVAALLNKGLEHLPDVEFPRRRSPDQGELPLKAS